MIVCLKCQAPLTRGERGLVCPACRAEYSERDGILQLLSEAENTDAFFQIGKFEILYHSEETNFWFRVRNIIIGDTITRYLPRPSRVLEVGCGTGYVSRYLKSLGYQIECADLFFDALQFCRQRDAGFQYYQHNLLESSFSEEFDAVCAFDVIEHIDEDGVALRHLHDALRPGGLLFITVPADMRLWSHKDRSARHKRRYSAPELSEKLRACNFDLIKMSYFMTFLYPALLFSRKISMKQKEGSSGETKGTIKKEEMDELQPNRILNAIFYIIFRLEVPLIRRFNLPFGSSLLCVAKKRQ